MKPFVVVLLFLACVFAGDDAPAGGGGDSKTKKWDGVFETKDGEVTPEKKYIKGKMSGN